MRAIETVMPGVERGARTLLANTTVPANEWDFMVNPTKPGGGVFQSLIDKVKEIGAGGYELLLVVGVIGLACSILMTVISVLFTSSAQKKEEKKSHAVTICLCGIVMFSVFSIIFSSKYEYL